MVDQREKNRMWALLVLQVVVYGYLLATLVMRRFMSFPRGWGYL